MVLDGALPARYEVLRGLVGAREATEDLGQELTVRLLGLGRALPERSQASLVPPDSRQGDCELGVLRVGDRLPALDRLRDTRPPLGLDTIPELSGRQNPAKGDGNVTFLLSAAGLAEVSGEPPRPGRLSTTHEDRTSAFRGALPPPSHRCDPG